MFLCILNLCALHKKQRSLSPLRPSQERSSKKRRLNDDSDSDEPPNTSKKRKQPEDYDSNEDTQQPKNKKQRKLGGKKRNKGTKPTQSEDSETELEE